MPVSEFSVMQLVHPRGISRLSIASLLALVTAAAEQARADCPPTPPSTTWATIKIQNNFSSTAQNAPRYFGHPVTDDQIWLYLHKDPGGGLCYTELNSKGTPTPSTLSQGEWVALSKVQNGEFAAPTGSNNASLYAVISLNQPTREPVPVAACTQECPIRDFAYGALEWDFHVPNQENADIQNIDQFSFTNRFTISSAGVPIHGNGFSGRASSQEILDRIDCDYGGGEASYPGGTNFATNYPITPAGCSLPTGCDGTGFTCSGIPRDYFTGAAIGQPPYNRMTQKIAVDTGILAIDNENPYRWVGSTKTLDSQIVGKNVTVMQEFGESFEPYLTDLYNSPQNASGYYVDYNGTWCWNGGVDCAPSGYSYKFAVTKNQYGHGIEIYDIRISTLQPGGVGDGGLVIRESGTPLAGNITILPNGTPILNTPMNGCPAVLCTQPGTQNLPFNSYGNWTDLQLKSGAPERSCNLFGNGPVVGTTIANYQTDENQAMISTFMASLSTAFVYGIITPTWNPLDGEQGTNWIFANATPQNSSGLLFQAGAGNSDSWVRSLWQYQDSSQMPNSTVNRSPLYVSTYADRFALMPVDPPVPQNAEILWELGVPMSVSGPAACPADFDHSGSVDGADLAILLDNWGPCTSKPCQGDINLDGSVNGEDLASLLTAWGCCPN